MPEELQSLIFTALNKAHINPESISIYYRDTIDVDPFGHDTISATGPTILTKAACYLVKDTITGYEPATITFHRQNSAKLTKNQFLAKLQHTITHLKEAHNEQIALLQNAIGPEQFEQYAQSYKQALEREADFIEPIHSATTAKVVQQAFLDYAFNTALKEVKMNRAKYGLDNKETSLMICPPPGYGPMELEKIASFEDLENYLNNKKEKIYQQLATAPNGSVDYNQINAFKTAVNKDTHYVTTVCYQTPLKEKYHS